MGKDLDYNPAAPEKIEDPYPIYRRLRREHPVHRSRRLNAWVFARYEEVDAILRDHRRFSSDPRARHLNRRQRESLPERDEYTQVFLDPPEHTRLRAILGKAFTRQLAQSVEAYIRKRSERDRTSFAGTTRNDDSSRSSSTGGGPCRTRRVARSRS